MPEKKINWGTLVIGIIIGLVVMWIINAYARPATGQSVIVGPGGPGAIFRDCRPIEGVPGCECANEAAPDVVPAIFRITGGNFGGIGDIAGFCSGLNGRGPGDIRSSGYTVTQYR